MFTCENCRRQVGSGKKMNKRIIATRPVEYTRTVETYRPRDVVVGKGHETVCEAALCETCAEGFDKGIPLANMAKVASKEDEIIFDPNGGNGPGWYFYNPSDGLRYGPHDHKEEAQVGLDLVNDGQQPPASLAASSMVGLTGLSSEKSKSISSEDWNL